MTDLPVTKTAEQIILEIAVMLATERQGQGRRIDWDIWAESITADDQEVFLSTAREAYEMAHAVSGAPSEEQIERGELIAELEAVVRCFEYDDDSMAQLLTRSADALRSAGVGSPVPVQVDEAKAEALEEAVAQIPFPADPYGGFDHESLRGAYTQMTNWLRGRAEMLRGGAQ